MSKQLNNYVELMSWLIQSPEHRAKGRDGTIYRLAPDIGLRRTSRAFDVEWHPESDDVRFPCEAIEPPKPEPKDWEEMPWSTGFIKRTFHGATPSMLTPTIERICRRIIKEELEKNISK